MNESVRGNKQNALNKTKSAQNGVKSVVVITGASSGIGLAAARYFSQKGCTVYGLSRHTVTDCFESVSADVTDGARVESVLKDIYLREGRIDCLINNAGIGVSGATEYIPDENTHKLFELNVLAVFSVSRLAAPYLKESKGKIINTSSIAAIIPIPFQTAYSASKAAVNLFTQCLRLELDKFGVKTCAVMPGDTKTGFTAAREKTIEEGGYGKRVSKSVSRMEKDEKNGKDPVTVAKVMYRLFKRKNPPALVAVGFLYKLIAFLAKILPQRLLLYLVGKLYG